MKKQITLNLQKVFAMFVALMFIVQFFPISGLAIGTGTASDPILIYDESGLRAMSNGLDKHYKLANDITLTGYWTPVGGLTSQFTGSLNGDGHVIRNLNISVSGSNNKAGLFGYTKNAKITNLGIEGGNINSTTPGTGTFVGSGMNTTVFRCYSKVSINGVNITGGIIGESSSCTIEQCFSAGNIKGSMDTGGIVGLAEKLSNSANTLIKDCYSTGEISGGANTGGIVGWSSYSNIENCYVIGAITSSSWGSSIVCSASGSVYVAGCVAMSRSVIVGNGNRVIGIKSTTATLGKNIAYKDMVLMIGDKKKIIDEKDTGYYTNYGASVEYSDFYDQNTFVNMGWDFGNVWVMNSAVSKMPTLKNIASAPQAKSVDFPIGTKENPYLISTQAQLAAIPSTGMGYHYRLVNDITLTGAWTPIGLTITSPRFCGVFDGGGHTIKGLYVNATGTNDRCGLFGLIENATIKNLRVEGTVYNKGAGGTGTIAGVAMKSTISQCYANVNVSSTSTVVGGIVGKSESSTIEQCVSTGSVSGHSTVGGIVGFATTVNNGANTIVRNCFNTGNTIGGLNTGGITGSGNAGTITNCYATGTVNGSSATVGGINGSVGGYTTVSGCVSICPEVFSGAPRRITQNVSSGTYGTNLALDTTILRSSSKTLTPVNGTTYDGYATSLAALKQQSTYTALGWDFQNIWYMHPNKDFPQLQWMSAIIGDQPLNAPKAPTFLNGLVTVIPSDNNAANYFVQLYKGNTVEAKATVSITALTVDLLSAIKENGVGAYTVTATAKATKKGYTDSLESPKSNVITIAELPAPAFAVWSDKTATWGAVPNAVGYKVELFRENVSLGTVTTNDTSYDFSNEIADSGDYYFTVIAISNENSLYLDSPATASNSENFSAIEPPVTDLAPDTYNSVQKLGLSTSTNGATIWYTVDGSDPKISSTVKKYNNPIDLLTTTTVKAFAERGSARSDTVSFTYTINVALTDEPYSFYLDGIEYRLANRWSTELTLVNGLNAYYSDIVIPDEITLGDKVYQVKLLAQNAFTGSESITSIVLPKHITRYERYNFGSCPNLSYIELRSSAALEYYMLAGCTSLETVKLAEGINIIRGNAFSGCTSLENVILPNSLTTIESSAFSGCTSLWSLSIPSNVSTLGGNAFKDCTSLETIIINGTITVVNSSTFENCTALREVTLPDTVKTIGSSAFLKCVSLREIVIPSAVESIGSNAFSGCEALERIMLPESLKIIGSSAFRNCKSLQEITFPSSVTNIGEWSFFDCSNLKTIRFEGNNPPTLTNAFTIKADMTIIVPAGTIGSYAPLFPISTVIVEA